MQTANEQPEAYPPGPDMGAVALATLDAASGYVAVGAGAVFGIALTAASQVWGTPTPRALLIQMAYRGLSLALVSASGAIGFGVLRRFDAPYRAIPRSRRTSNIIISIYAVLLAFFVLHHGYELARTMVLLKACGEGHGPAICAATLEDASKPDYRAKVRAYLDTGKFALSRWM